MESEPIYAEIGGRPGPLPPKLVEKIRPAFRLFFYGGGPHKGLFSSADVPVRELARILGIAPSNLTNLLGGQDRHHYPNRKSVQKFADRLGIPVEQMMSRLVVHVIRAKYLIGKDVLMDEAEYLGELCSPREAASLLGTYQQAVTKLIRTGQLKAYRMNSYWKVPIAEIERYRMERKGFSNAGRVDSRP